MNCKHCAGTGVEPDNAAIGAAMRGIRIASHQTLRNVAATMEISATYLSDLELGRRNWNHDILAKFQRATDPVRLSLYPHSGSRP